MKKIAISVLIFFLTVSWMNVSKSHKINDYLSKIIYNYPYELGTEIDNDSSEELNVANCITVVNIV